MTVPAGTALAPHERAYLLAAPQLGPRLLALIEAAGFGSLAEMRAAGAARVLRAVQAQGGHWALNNRLRALERALALGASRASLASAVTPPAHATFATAPTSAAAVPSAALSSAWAAASPRASPRKVSASRQVGTASRAGDGRRACGAAEHRQPVFAPQRVKPERAAPA